MGVTLGAISSSCNSKDEDTVSNSSYTTTESVAITNFSLTADIRVMKNLDSVFFSIDLEHGVVFNADSLPKGTKIHKLIPKITYPSSVTEAVIEMTGGSHRQGTVNYLKNASDTIDFTGDVKLTLKAGEDISKTYTLKVNVHQLDPDTVFWESTSSMGLPSRMPSPVAQKTVECGSRVISVIQEADASFTISSTSNIFEGLWSKTKLDLQFNPQLNTLTAAPDGTLYMLGEDGTLMASADGTGWNAVATGWTQLVGMYGDTLLGMSMADGRRVTVSWPSGPIEGIAVPDSFPLSGYSSPIEFTNRWTPYPTIVVFGGYPFNAGGKSASWAFDGSQWVDIADNALPAISGLAVVDYYSFLKSATNSHLKEFEVFLAFGGEKADGNPNETVYISYDHGINWMKAPDYMQLPDDIRAGRMADALALGTTMESALSNRWKAPVKRRLPFEVIDDMVRWDCPYIFIFGGYDASGDLIPAIRSGVLQRLTFEPLF